MSNESIDAFLKTIPGMNGPGSIVFLYALVLVPMVTIAVRRRAGLATYLRMPLHLVAITVIAVAIKYLAHPLFGVPMNMTTLNSTGWWFIVIAPGVAFLWAYFRYGGWARGSGDTHKRGAVVLDGAQAVQETRRLKRKHGEDMLTLAGV